MTRTEFLRGRMREAAHKCARISMPPEWDVSDTGGSLSERKARAIRMIFEKMPLYVGEQELIVGTRTIYGEPGDASGDLSYFDYQALPHYVNQADRDFFGFDMEFVTQAHYAPDFGIILSKGLKGLLLDAQEGSKRADIPEVKREFYLGEIIALEGLSALILRYARYLEEEKEKDGYPAERREELGRMAGVCRRIAQEPPSDYFEACQLFWFAYLGCIVENFQFINYGRIDQVLSPFAGTLPEETEQQLTECLLLKMFDMYDIKLLDRTLMGVYSAQHNITIGGVTRDGKDGANRVTFMVLTALSRTRLPEPLVSVRLSSQNPSWVKEMACELSAAGMNCINYYNDDLYVETLRLAGLKAEDARDYGFGLCQDVLIPGRGDHYCSGGINLTLTLLELLREQEDVGSFEELKALYIARIRERIHTYLEQYNRWEQAVLQFNEGNPEPFLQGYREGSFDVFAPAQGLSSAQAARNQSGQGTENKQSGQAAENKQSGQAAENKQSGQRENNQSGQAESMQPGQPREELYANSLMSPLPITSALYHGCMEKGADVARCGCVNGDKGVMVLTPVVAVNALAAIKKVVFEDGFASLREVCDACDANFEGYEILRQRLWNAPKWGNDDPAVDDDAVDIFSAALDEVNAHTTPKGGRHLGGLHQPHPVFAGRNIPATPEGRFAGTPIPVTISPENGTVHRGPTAAMMSAAKIDWRKIKWNVCLMLQYYASAFRGEDGRKKLGMLLDGYFAAGGLQHQPNIVDVEDLKKAQKHPEQYRDLIIRMWGVSAYFVDLPRDVQDEFIARYDGL